MHPHVGGAGFSVLEVASKAAVPFRCESSHVCFLPWVNTWE